MSYYVEWLLLNKEEILRNSDLDSDDYSNLLELDSVINTLSKEGKLQDFQLNIIYNFDKVRTNDKNGHAYRTFSRICSRIFKYLDQEYSDASWVSRLIRTHCLNSEQSRQLYEYIKGKGNIEI
jgi:hypothetical protein